MPLPSRGPSIRPRLLFIATDAMTAEVLMSGQLAWLTSKGFDVAVAAGAGATLDRVASRENVRAFGIPFVREMSPFRDLVAMRKLLECINDFRPHIVNAGTPKAGLAGMIAARIAGVHSRIYLQRGLRLETTRGLKRQVLRNCERIAAQSAHHVVCVSASLRDAIAHEKIVDRLKLCVLGAGSSNGVDCTRFSDMGRLQKTADEFRQTWKIPSDAPVVGFIGRLTRDKGIADLAHAFLEVGREIENAHLVIVGPEEKGDPVGSDAMRRLRSDARVRFVGHQPDVAPWHRLFDVLAFPSYREGLPNVPLEAAASGRPVVGYAATGTVDAVRDGVTGTLVMPGDREGFADALRCYLLDPMLRARHGQAGSEFVYANFAREVVWQNWLNLYIAELWRIGMAPPRELDDQILESTVVERHREAA